MRDKIYTIPISEAFENNCICPFCTIHNKLDKQYTERAVGAGMMEPSIRVLTNKQGFCKVHYKKMREQNQVLPLSLVLQSHLNENLLSLFDTQVVQKKKSLFSSKTDISEQATEVLERLKTHNRSCYICSKVNKILADYIDTTIYMFKTDSEFKTIFKNTDHFCLEHAELLLNSALNNLGEKDLTELFEALADIERDELKNLYSSITELANSFDYRAKGQISDKAKSSIADCIDII
ncbi:MAG: DUF6062 family protein [Eubacteriales bacterium]|nr:DUF6062 family protein [Eubacteriales bacterium]